MDINHLSGKILTRVDRTVYDGNDAIRFEADDGVVYWLTHRQDCCESVDLEDLDGDLQDLVDAPILYAEQVSGIAPHETPEYGDWTFYRIQSSKGFVLMRWYGESEYYGTSVSFFKESER